MNYNEALSYVHSLSKFGSKPGLERVSRLVSLAKNPQKDLKFIHIAGTSGKGSTATLISSILEKSGLKVGLFTSPYIVDFRERFMINGEKISKDDFCRLASFLYPLVKSLNDDGIVITEFEFNTVLGFLYFKEQKCDIVCLEVGMGGRFDATNLIDSPLVSVITSIGLDHIDILGDTYEKIAFEKCGIIKTSCPVVSYPLQRDGAFNVISDTCEQKNCELSIPDTKKLKLLSENVGSSCFQYEGKDYKINLSGIHQVYNAITAIETVKMLNKSYLEVSDDAIYNGILSAKAPARLEIISEKPLIIIDGAHNADKVNALYTFINRFKGKIVSICGMLKDKDYEKAASQIAPLCKKIVTVTPNNPRALSSKQMADTLSKYCADVTPIDDVKSAAHYALSLLEENDVLVCWGSLYIAGEVREELKGLL